MYFFRLIRRGAQTLGGRIVYLMLALLPIFLVAGCVSSMITEWNMLRGFGKNGHRQRIQVGGESPFVDLSPLQPGSYCKVSLRNDDTAAAYEGYVQQVDSEKVVLIEAGEEPVQEYGIPVAKKVPWLNRIFRKKPNPDRAVHRESRVEIMLAEIENVEHIPESERMESSQLPEAYVVSEESRSISSKPGKGGGEKLEHESNRW